MLSKGMVFLEAKISLEGEKMKTIFQTFAKYNQSVNLSILELVEPLPEEILMVKTKAFYPSLFETMFHNLLSDLFWLNRFREAFKECKALTNQVVSLDFSGLRTEVEGDYKKMFSYRKQLDEIILQLMGELDENAISSTFKYKTFRGKDMENILWKILLQWFNHQTHHRGQISVLLDMVDVKNDYSSMTNRI
jgi:uncharacterized damage-inducible protein DinB